MNQFTQILYSSNILINSSNSEMNVQWYFISLKVFKLEKFVAFWKKMEHLLVTKLVINFYDQMIIMNAISNPALQSKYLLKLIFFFFSFLPDHLHQ